MRPTELKCSECGATFPLKEERLRCRSCGQTLVIDYEFEREEKLEDSLAAGDFSPLTPLEGERVSLGEGETQTIGSKWSGPRLGIDLTFKLEFLNPTGSFKDRGNSILVSWAKERGATRLVDDSSGNAGSSLAAYSARCGLDCTIYVPERASGGKVVQIQSYGAKLKKVAGSRERVTEELKEDWTDDSDLYYASHNLSPFFLEGMKTLAYEIWLEKKVDLPDHIVFPVGGGALLLGAFRGFSELREGGLIEEIPRLHAAQPAACAPVVAAFREDLDYIPQIDIEETVAEGTHIGQPARGKEILAALGESGGRAFAVAEEEIKTAYTELAQKEGLFVEPTSALTMGALKEMKAKKVLENGEEVLLPLTGSGLKDISTAKGLI